MRLPPGVRPDRWRRQGKAERVMDGIQAINQATKAKAGADVAAGAADDASPSNAFSALLQSLGARFNSDLGLDAFNKFESKLLSQDDASQAARMAEERDAAAVRDDQHQ